MGIVQHGVAHSRERWSITLWWALFALLLAIVTSRHEMFADEVQPWLWVRYEHNLFHSIQHLHYEAHPAVWTILLFVVSRISHNIALLQGTNYLLALACAWLILSFRPIPFSVRVLIVFGESFFFIAGVLARDYMVSGLLLIGAARCLLAERKRHWSAITLLALAINAHFLAIPVAAGIFIWLYWIDPGINVEALTAKLRTSRFWLSSGLLALSLLTCYLTVRPAVDIETTEDLPGATFFDYFVLGAGRLWHYFLPLNVDAGAVIQNGTLAFSAYVDLIISLLLGGLALAVLPSRRSRYFMITASALWLLASLLTVRRPLLTHASLLAMIYIIALMIRREEDVLGAGLREYAAQPLLIALLSFQVFGCLQFCLKEMQGPFSSGKAVADWIESAGLKEHPIVSQPELAAPAVMAYTGAATVYFPGCQCSRPYVLYRRGWQSERAVTLEELDLLRRATGLDPVLLSGWPLNKDDLNKLGLKLAFTAPKSWAWDNETVSVYVARASEK